VKLYKEDEVFPIQKTSCDLRFKRERYRQIQQHGYMKRFCNQYFGIKLCMGDEVFGIYVQFTKFGRLITLSNTKILM
jgi:hypothetical protein